MTPLLLFLLFTVICCCFSILSSIVSFIMIKSVTFNHLLMSLGIDDIPPFNIISDLDDGVGEVGGIFDNIF